MRYIVMHKVDPVMEAGGPPDQRIVEEMGELVGSSIQSGIFQNGAGLHRSARRKRISGAEVSDGPYAGKNELVAAFVMVKAPSIDGAVAHAQKLAEACGGADVEIGPVVEAWDLGIMPKPEGKLPERFLLLVKSADDAAPSPEARAGFDAFVARLKDEGVLLAVEALAPSARGARRAPGAKARWVDGPFAESKELIAGFSILELPARADVLAWADRYAAILGRNEVEVRELTTPAA